MKIDYDLTTMTGNTTVNGTTAYVEETIVTVFKVLITIILAVVTFGMGCAVELEKLRQTVKSPRGLLVGLACQIFLMPVLAFALIKVSSMSPIQALVFMLVGSCPGGGTSNIITYLAEGDMSLSLSMTTISNVLALGTVPLWMLLYTKIENIAENLPIPYSSLGISLATLIIPIVLGVLFRYRYPNKARPLPKILAIVGFVTLVAVAIGMIVSNKIPIKFSLASFMPVAILPLAGMLLSYGASSLPGLTLSHKIRRTIAVEIAIQNGNLSNTVVFLSFGHRIDLLAEVLTIPILYNATQFFYCFLLVAVFKLGKYRENGLSRQKRYSIHSNETVTTPTNHVENGAYVVFTKEELE